MGHYKQLIYALFNIYFIPYYSSLNKKILQNLIQKLNEELKHSNPQSLFAKI